MRRFHHRTKLPCLKPNKTSHTLATQKHKYILHKCQQFQVDLDEVESFVIAIYVLLSDVGCR